MLVILGVPGYFIYRWKRQEKRAEQTRIAALRSLAEQLGGSQHDGPGKHRPALGPAPETPWRPVQTGHRPGCLAGPHAPPTGNFAMEVRRGHRQIRISEYYALIHTRPNTVSRTYE